MMSVLNPLYLKIVYILIKINLSNKFAFINHRLKLYLLDKQFFLEYRD